jgi:hypothetical protein
MRRILALVVLGCVFAGYGRARAADKDDAVAILDKAIKAQGGADALAKAVQFIRKGTGTLTLIEMDFAITDELLVQRPHRLRLTREVVGPDKQKTRVVLVLNKDMGWQENGGVAAELSEQRVSELKEEVRVQSVCLLLPLVLKDSAYQLATAKEILVDGKAAAGVRASLKGHPDITLYFDKDSGLLVKIDRKAKEAGIEVDKEHFFSDYKEVDGVKLPTRAFEKLNGKKFTDLKVDSYKLLDRVDEAQFGKP